MEKIVTINHFLNKRLKPKVKNNKSYYPSYCEVSYKGKGTQFLFDWDSFLRHESKHWTNRFTEDEFQKIKTFETELIESVNKDLRCSIKFEFDKHGNEFSFKGYSKRFNFYTECFTCEYNRLISNEIDDVVLQEITKKQFERAQDRVISIDDPYRYLKFIKKKYDVKIFEKVNDILWNKIGMVYLLDSFMDYNDDSRNYGSWIYGNSLKLFKEYFNSEKHLSKNSINRKTLKKLNLKELSIYIKIIEGFINKKLRKMEIDHFI